VFFCGFILLLTLINGFNKIHMWSYPEMLKSVYIALIGIFAVYISTHKLMLYQYYYFNIQNFKLSKNFSIMRGLQYGKNKINV